MFNCYLYAYFYYNKKPKGMTMRLIKRLLASYYLLIINVFNFYLYAYFYYSKKPKGMTMRLIKRLLTNYYLLII